MKLSSDEARKVLVGKTVVFNEHVASHEIDFDEGMKAVITNITLYNDEDNIYTIFFDMSKFMDHNRSKMQANYYDCNGVPRETWEQQRHFPKHGKVDFFFNFEWRGELVELPFDLEEDLKDIYIFDDAALEATAKEIAAAVSPTQNALIAESFVNVMKNHARKDKQ